MIIPSTVDLLPVCSHILEEELRPIHYKDLSIKAVEKMGLSVDDVVMYRTIEDVREKLPAVKRYDVVYTGAPHCLMAKKRWFIPTLLHVDSILIPGHVSSGCNGAFEALMRDSHMLYKYGRTEKTVSKRANGLVIERHVADWFASKWPEFYREPDNYKQWQRPCQHDFKLEIDGKVHLVDVASPTEHSYHSHNKLSTHLHLLCKISPNGQDIIWESVMPGKYFLDGRLPEEGRSPHNMVVWLNCHKSGVDYTLFSGN